MAFTQRICSGLVLLCFALFLIVCFADEAANNKDNNDDVKTIRGINVSARILARSGKIMIVRNDDDDDDDKDGDDSAKKDTNDGGDDVDSKDDSDDKDGSNEDDDDKDDDDDDFKDDNEDLLTFEVDEIKEKDSDGKEVDDKHSVESLDDVKFQFSHVRQSSYQGIPVITVNLSAYLDDPKATLEIIVYLFREAGSISFGNETFAVKSGTVKFNIKISNWSFCDDTPADCSEGKAGKYLDLSLKIKSKGSPEEVDDDDRKKADKDPICKDKDDKDDDDKDDDDNDDDDDDDDCPIIYNIGGDSEMLLNRGVITDDDKYTTMPVGFPKFERDDDGEKKFIFRIPKFNKTVLVDPSVNVGKVLVEKVHVKENAASWLQFNVAVAVLLQVAAIFIAQ